MKIARFADAVVLSPTGRIDHATANDFRQALLDHLVADRAGDRRIVIDLGGVDYIASVGLRALMIASRQVKAQNGTLVLARLQPLVREIFEISKFTLIFPIHATVRDALADVSPRALAAFEAV